MYNHYLHILLEGIIKSLLNQHYFSNFWPLSADWHNSTFGPALFLALQGHLWLLAQRKNKATTYLLGIPLCGYWQATVKPCYEIFVRISYKIKQILDFSKWIELIYLCHCVIFRGKNSLLRQSLKYSKFAILLEREFLPLKIA